MRSAFSALVLLALVIALPACDSGGSGSALEDAFDCAVDSISLGGSVSGALASSDCDYLDDDGTVTDYYAFTITETLTVDITQESDAIDSFLTLYTDTASEITFDDDSAGGLDSRIVRQLAPGTYVISAGSHDTEFGPYTVRLQRSTETRRGR